MGDIVDTDDAFEQASHQISELAIKGMLALQKERDVAQAEIERLKAERDEFERLYKIALSGDHWHEDQCDKVERAVYEHLKFVGRPLHRYHNYGDAMDALPGELETLRKERDASLSELYYTKVDGTDG